MKVEWKVPKASERHRPLKYGHIYDQLDRIEPASAMWIECDSPNETEALYRSIRQYLWLNYRGKYAVSLFRADNAVQIKLREK